MANNAEAFGQGKHAGYEESAWAGLQQAIDVIAQKRIKVAINGGALNPSGLALKVAGLVKEKGHDLIVAYVSGDDVMPKLGSFMPQQQQHALPHLDSQNGRVTLTPESFSFAKESKGPREIVSANAYLGARAIYEGFRKGADIVICGRVSDASPVIACAWYWWSWSSSDYDSLAGALIAGHLVECSAYVTGGNFSGFDTYDIDRFINPGFPIAEIAKDGTCVITKHPGTGGIVNVDTCRCQLVYELQGNVYLNSDVKAYLDNVLMDQVGENRVFVSGVRGAPPPETTKLAVFYKGGYEIQALFNCTGYAFEEKFQLFEKQVRYFLGPDVMNQLDTLDFQRIGVPAANPRNQNSSTIYLRIFAQSTNVEALGLVGRSAGRPPAFEKFGERESYDTQSPVPLPKQIRRVRLGNIALGRSGDKGSNLNFGLFVHTSEEWDWLRSYLSIVKVKELLADEIRRDFSIERVEFPGIFAVHFVVYGILGRGVSSSKRLDGFGKGFIDYFRDKLVEVPSSILKK
ncbi:hypothetical protein ACJ41O_006522 [Fusarium nematophilum]